MKVAVLGPPGTYTHQAADRYFSTYDPVFCDTIQDVIEHEEMAKIIPFENSLGGGVAESCDLLREHGPTVTGEVRLEVDHHLLSHEDTIADIRTVRSHPQALAQCRSYIDDRGWETEETTSTAAAATDLGRGEAAIASQLAGELNDCNVLASGIQDRRSVTRFLILEGNETTPEKTSIILEPGEDAPGLLHDMLGCFADHDINLSYIQSRPTRTGLGEYFFYVEAETGSETARFTEAHDCLKELTDVTVLGSYEQSRS